MTRRVIVDRYEVVLLLKKTYGLKDVQFMRKQGCEPDGPVCEDFEYIIGEEVE
jgi:hypothetical protein